MKLGRNDKCHCGSGKKYKKCCLHSDETEQRLSSKRNFSEVEDYVDDFEEGEYFENDYDILENDYSDDEDEVYVEKSVPSNSYPCKKFEENIPELSNSDQKIVDDWWDRFRKVYITKSQDINRCLELIKKFTTEHPSLVSNLYLHEEALFELDAAFLRVNDYSTFIEFLIWFRENAFEAYSLSGAYYDVSIISFLVVHNRLDEIPKYFSLFKEYPDHNPDQLMKAIDILRACNQEKLLIALMEDIYPNLYYSSKVFGGGDFVVPILESTFYNHFKKEFSDEDLESLISDLKEIDQKIPDFGIYTEKEYWKNLINQTYNRNYEVKDNKSKDDYRNFYRQVLNHFTGYLHQSKNMEWTTASYNSSLVGGYLSSFLEGKKKPKHLFSLNENTIDSYVARNFRDLLSLREVPSLTFLKGLKYFVEYIGSEGLIPELEAIKARNVCGKLSERVYQICSSTCYVSNLFNGNYLTGANE